MADDCPTPNGLAPNVGGFGVGFDPKVKAFDDEVGLVLVDPNGMALFEPKTEDGEGDDVDAVLPNENVEDEAKEKVDWLDAAIGDAPAGADAPKEKTDAVAVDETFVDPKEKVVEGPVTEVVVVDGAN